MKSINLTADDYAISPGVSEAIRELITHGRLSSTSVMTSTPYWQTEGAKLLALDSSAQIGLHFDLTSSIAPLEDWLKHALVGSMDPRIIADALRVQFQAFRDVMGRSPDYIDSHQHVHTFPRIRGVFIKTLQEISPEKKITLRSLNHIIPPTDCFIKTCVLRALSSGFNRVCAGHPINPAFAGIYSLSDSADFPSMLDTWIKNAPENTLIMVHPGKGDAFPDDTIHEARQAEFRYLSSPAFGQFLDSHQIKLR